MNALLIAAVPLGVVPAVQQAYLKASDATNADWFGTAVAMAGDTLVVGAPGADADDGAAYVLVRSGGTWLEQAELAPPAGPGGGSFGASVAVSGDTIAVGAPRAAVASSQGAQDDAGAVSVFVRSGTSWTEQATLSAPSLDAHDLFGHSVALSGDTLVVGAFGESSGATGVDGDQGDDSAPDAGAAYVFVRSGTSWSLQAYLKASNTDPNDGFGRSVAIDGDTLVVGATGEDSAATGVNGDEADDTTNSAGAAYAFVRSGTTWTQQAYIKASNAGHFDAFGLSLGLSGDTLAVGAIGERSSATGVDGDETDNALDDAGAAYVFVRSGTTWAQQAYIKASNTGANDLFGWSLAVAGDDLVVGAMREGSAATGVNGDEGDDSAHWAGAAYVFARSAGTWGQTAYLKGSNTDEDDLFGSGVAVADRTVVVGASEEDSNGTGVGGDPSQGPSHRDVGAAYAFDLDPDELGVRLCSPAVPNSTGQPGVMTVLGSTTVSDDYLVLVASELPATSNIGYFVMGTGSNTFTPPGSAGPICVAPGLKRYLPPVANTNQLPGGFQRAVGTGGPVSGLITPASTWSFQAWHRDGMAPSNLTDAVSVVFD